MNWVALRILTGDRGKYLGLIFAIAFSTFLIAQQSSLFVVVINRTRSFIVDVTDADIWVMAPATRYLDEVFSLKDNDVDRVRSVPGVRWAVPFYKGSARVIAADGQFRQTTLLGVDDASLAGAPEPRRMVLGSVENLRDPDAVVIDLAGYNSLFPGEPLTLGKTLEMNDHRAKSLASSALQCLSGRCPSSTPAIALRSILSGERESFSLSSLRRVPQGLG